MPEVEVFDKKKKSVSKINLPEGIFDGRKRTDLLHEAVVNHLANARQGTASTKNRSAVRGGGAKPYRQKGTGRARAGTNNSPLWRGGGTVFGPTPRSYAYSMPRKMRRAAIRAALSAKLVDGEFMVVQELGVSEAKTREVAALMKQLGLEGRVTFVIPEKDEAFELAARNLRYVRVLRVGQMGVYDIVNAGQIVAAADAVSKMEEVYLK